MYAKAMLAHLRLRTAILASDAEPTDSPIHAVIPYREVVGHLSVGLIWILGDVLENRVIYPNDFFVLACHFVSSCPGKRSY
jgi:hypothetical protein